MRIPPPDLVDSAGSLSIPPKAILCFNCIDSTNRYDIGRFARPTAFPNAHRMRAIALFARAEPMAIRRSVFQMLRSEDGPLPPSGILPPIYVAPKYDMRPPRRLRTSAQLVHIPQLPFQAGGAPMATGSLHGGGILRAPDISQIALVLAPCDRGDSTCGRCIMR